MFPRIKKSARKGGAYEYLVISESIRDDRGRSTTRDIARLGNVARFDQRSVKGLIDGLIRLFEIDEYGLTDQVEILESLEHGSIIFWRALWDRLGLGELIADCVKSRESRITIPVEKYVEMMVVNRCVAPLSKLGTSRWMDTTCYAAMKGYASLPRDVEYFYRSMDYLVKAKDAIEAGIFERLRNLFSVNVRLTFYDITSTFFYGDGCALAANGHSRDMRPDKKQVVIGVVTSYEGYPLKHYVFEGNTQDQTTVGEVVRQLREQYHVEETIFVGDRGMISRLNLDRIQNEEYDYIMGVKARQDEMMLMVFEDEQLFDIGAIESRGLTIVDRRFSVSDFLAWKIARILELTEGDRRKPAWSQLNEILATTAAAAADADDRHAVRLTLSDLHEPLLGLGAFSPKQRRKVGALLKKYHGRYAETIRVVCARNEERAQLTEKKRTEKLDKLSKELDKVFAAGSKNLIARLEKIFAGHNGRYRRFFTWSLSEDGETPVSYTVDQSAFTAEKRYDGVFVLATNRRDLPPEKVVASYKNLQEVETLFDDLKHFVDIHPVRHWLPIRVRAHVLLCIQALLLKRILEIDCLKSKALTATLETVAKSKLIKYRVRMSERSSRTKTFRKVTISTPEQARCFAAVGIRNSASLEHYMW